MPAAGSVVRLSCGSGELLELLKTGRDRKPGRTRSLAQAG